MIFYYIFVKPMLFPTTTKKSRQIFYFINNAKGKEKEKTKKKSCIMSLLFGS